MCSLFRGSGCCRIPAVASILVFFIMLIVVPEITGFTTSSIFHRPITPHLQSVRNVKGDYRNIAVGLSYFSSPSVVFDWHRSALGPVEYEIIGPRRRRRAAITHIFAKKSFSNVAAPKKSGKSTPKAILKEKSGAEGAAAPLPESTTVSSGSPPEDFAATPAESSQANPGAPPGGTNDSPSAPVPVYEQFNDRHSEPRKKTASTSAPPRNGYNSVVKTLSVKVIYRYANKYLTFLCSFHISIFIDIYLPRHSSHIYVCKQDLDHGMKMRYLPGTDTLVSELGLGTMTFGEQTCKENALKMLDEAVYKFGINLIVRLIASQSMYMYILV